MNAPIDLTAIRVSLAKLAPLPWTVATEIDGVRAGRNTVVKSDGKRVFTVDQTRPHHDTTAEANAAFTAAAPETVLALVREVEQVRKAWDEALGLLDAMTDISRKQKRQVDAGYAFAAEMATYCSHLGVSATYAARLVSRLDIAGGAS